MIFEQLHTV